MGIQVALHHETRYRYARPVALGPQTIQLRPAPHSRTPILSYSCKIEPSNATMWWQFDALSNHVARVNVPGKTDELSVNVDLVAELNPVNPFDFVLEPSCATLPFDYADHLARDLEPYRSVDCKGVRLDEFVDGLAYQGQATVGYLVDLNARIRDEIGYTTRLEHGVQTCEETLHLQTGSCRDSAWLLVQIFRRLGLAARFVSGYLIQLTDENDVTSPAVDSADLHAWAEVYLPGAGWIGFDPTSGLLTAEGHIPLACGSTPAGTAPISGTAEPADVDFSFKLSVTRLNEIPTIFKPYSEADWARVRSVAQDVDRQLAEHDVRLTMGGEPTFVGADEAESAQWNIEALGPLKRKLGLSLIQALRRRTAPGGLLHLGQGKWYPGEPLPRWAFHCVSRMDGVPVWDDAGLFALEERDYGFEPEDAFTFLQALAKRLGAQPENILVAVEPAFDSQPPTTPAGYVLPLRRRQAADHMIWSSQLWFDRPERFELAAGDSPIGFRIPVEAMPFVAPDTLAYELIESPDAAADLPLTNRVKLPASPLRRPELCNQAAALDTLPPIPADAASAPELVRPALCVQVRGGRLHVFVPYIPVLADFLDVVAAVEDAASYTQMPVWVEGYTAPVDPRVRFFSLTPDPGVLEVNLPPTSEWDDLESLNALLAEEAEKLRLVPGKFAYDGSHLATGGGSHITIGGPSVLESPVLRRPDLLRSMLSFWQNHPSLSYLFSGMYVGPTSQYPRVDEARVDALYELDVAFSHIPPHDCAPYILDGLFRNLLVDVTGNSHRAEFCIDKMYPPLGQGLRIGLLELRAFEMAPHYRMGLMQMLLVRALVCLFWKQPFTGELIRWGTALHDRFMLPHFVEQDFAAMLQHLQQAGFPLEGKWFAAQRDFRFPRIGAVAANGVELELRQALEPWNVLAEETTAGGTGRSVDSSLERIQVKVTGLDAASAKYVFACNGRKVPLHPTSTPGESIAGIRFRARRLSATLHPSIPVHTPLTFDLIDIKTRQCVARCTYHAGPPDGTVHTTRPADAKEARSRRAQRFVADALPAEPVPIPQSEPNAVFPMTLDMRWPPPAEKESAGS